MSDLIKQVEAERHHVVVDVYSATLNEMMDWYKNGDLKIDPAYQRSFRWTTSQQTKYVESLLLNIPTPPFFLAETETGGFEIIDGLQRFSSILKFFAAEIQEDAPSPSDDSATQNDILVPTLLTVAPILDGLAGMSRASLPDTLVRTLRYARVQIILLKKQSSPLARYHVFTRLNRAGSSLTDQEIRNCSARLFNPKFADELLEMSVRPEVIVAMALSQKESQSMASAENILRLLAFSHFSPRTQRVDEFLDEVMYNVASDNHLWKNNKEKVLWTFQIISQVFPKGEAFRFLKDGKFKGGFSSNLFDIVACGVYKNIDAVAKKSPAWLEEKIKDISNNSDAIALTGAGSNARSKMIGRVKFGQMWFKK